MMRTKIGLTEVRMSQYFTYKGNEFTYIYNKKTGALTVKRPKSATKPEVNKSYPANSKAAQNAKKEYEKSEVGKADKKKEEKAKTASEKKEEKAEKPAEKKEHKSQKAKPKDGNNNNTTPKSKKKKTIRQKFKEWKESPTGAAVTPLLGLMGLDIALQSSRYFFSPTIRETKRQLAILEEKRKKGTLGQDRALEAFQRQQLMRPIRALAEQQQREQQATMAGMGESLQPYRQELQQQQSKQSMIQGAVQAQQFANQAAAARKQEEENRRLSMLAQLDAERNKIYKGLKGGLTSVAGQVGKIRAAEAQLKPAQEHGEIVEDLKKIYPDLKDRPEMLRETALRIQEGKSKEKMAKTLGGLNYNDPDFTRQLVRTFTGMEE